MAQTGSVGFSDHPDLSSSSWSHHIQHKNSNNKPESLIRNQTNCGIMWSGNNPSVINHITFLLILKNVNISIDLTMFYNVNTLTQSVPAVAIQQITNWQPRSPYYILLTDESWHHDGGDNIMYLLCSMAHKLILKK